VTVPPDAALDDVAALVVLLTAAEDELDDELLPQALMAIAATAVSSVAAIGLT
jgi:hypothetical protein